MKLGIVPLTDLLKLREKSPGTPKTGDFGHLYFFLNKGPETKVTENSVFFFETYQGTTVCIMYSQQPGLGSRRIIGGVGWAGVGWGERTGEREGVTLSADSGAAFLVSVA